MPARDVRPDHREPTLEDLERVLREGDLGGAALALGMVAEASLDRPKPDLAPSAAPMSLRWKR